MLNASWCAVPSSAVGSSSKHGETFAYCVIIDVNVSISVRPVKLRGYTTLPLMSGLRSKMQLSSCDTWDRRDKSTDVPIKEDTCACGSASVRCV